MKCPYCGSLEHKVVDKRETTDTKATRRRRECLSCAKRFTTYERIEEMEIIVIKKDESRVPFDRQKVLQGLVRACEKRPVPYENLQKITDEIEATILNKGNVEITSREIGELVMRHLRKTDKVAYIRFASVYKSFEDVEEFEQELKKLKK